MKYRPSFNKEQLQEIVSRCADNKTATSVAVLRILNPLLAKIEADSSSPKLPRKESKSLIIEEGYLIDNSPTAKATELALAENLLLMKTAYQQWVAEEIDEDSDYDSYSLAMLYADDAGLLSKEQQCKAADNNVMVKELLRRLKQGAAMPTVGRSEDNARVVELAQEQDNYESEGDEI